MAWKALLGQAVSAMDRWSPSVAAIAIFEHESIASLPRLFDPNKPHREQSLLPRPTRKLLFFGGTDSVDRRGEIRSCQLTLRLC